MLALAAALPAGASAHGISGKADLPIPPWLFGWAAAVVLVLSFVALAALWPQPRLQDREPRARLRMPRAVGPICGAIGVAIFAAVIYAGYAGSPVPTANLAPTVVFVVFWVGFPFASVLFGDVFRAFNPWRAAARALAWVVVRAVRRPLPAPIEYPRWLGRWPAVLGVVAFAWLELAAVNRDDPTAIATAALIYAAFQLVGMGLFGIERWTRRGDAFSSLFSLFARLSPLTIRDGWVCTRPPLSGAPGLPTPPGTVALLAAAIGTTTFDGFSNGQLWQSLAPDLVSFFRSIGFGYSAAAESAATIGIVGCVLVIGGFYAIGVRGMRTVGEPGAEPTDLAGRFAHTLIPIAFAYLLAHYFSFFVYQSQAVGYLISDPLGDGADLLGTAGAQIDYNVVSPTAVWYVQVAALVCGHVAGLTLAHDRALALYRDVRDAVRSQLWMLVVMVGFTSLGLWLLSAVAQ